MPSQVPGLEQVGDTFGEVRGVGPDVQRSHFLTDPHLRGTPTYNPYPAQGSRIGTVSFPSLKMSWPIFQGTADAQLAKGVGHYLESVLPGETDNTVLAGHRETVFNRLEELKRNQEVIVSTAAGVFVYTIRKFRVVPRTDRTVIVPTAKGVLTLVTCYPINFVGTTDQSLIVVADLSSSKVHIE